ncbi:outer membrane beta-barrel protein [candidate division KSB1 bacterium]|nr:outer membrane beta-barrel protein [candidate division KSB1 bacterium]
MNKSLFIPGMMILIMAVSGSARTLKYGEIGINQSQFRNESCESRIGPSIGIGLDYYPIKSFDGFIGAGLIYNNKRILIKNRTWPSSIHKEDANWIWSGDFQINLSFVEIPLQIGYTIDVNDNFSTSIHAGYSLLIPIKDHTRVKNTKVTEIKNDADRDFDYFLVDEPYIPWSKNFHIGFKISFKRIALIPKYSRALSTTENIAGISMKGKIDSFQLFFVYSF